MNKISEHINADLLYLILDEIQIPICIINSANSILYYNLAFLKLTAYQETENIEQITDFIPQIDQLIAEGSKLTQFKSKNEPEELLASAIKVQDLYLVTFDYNVHLSSNLKSKRLQTLGLLSGGIAHDFNNILAGIIGHTAYLNTVLKDEEKLQVSLRAIEDGSKRAADLTKEIVKFSAKEDTDIPTIIDLQDLIERTANLMHGCLRPKTLISFTPPKDTFHIECVEVQLSQILINLITNAHDAQIEAENIHEDLIVRLEQVTPEVLKQYGLMENLNLSLIVEDHGCGMTEAQLQKATSPFFTTKSNRSDLYGGNGYGLSTVQRIVNQLHGKIVFESELGKGTVVKIFLPGTVVKSQSLVLDDPLEKETPSAGRILVVDDEDVVREVLKLNLEQFGFEVVTAENGQVALDLHKGDDSFDLVILDMLMPVMSGEEFFSEIRKKIPNQKILLASGFCSEDVKEALLDEGDCDFIAKPFQTEDLMKKIEDLIGVSN